MLVGSIKVTEVELPAGHVVLVKFPKEVPFAVREGNAEVAEDVRTPLVAAPLVVSLMEIAAVLLCSPSGEMTIVARAELGSLPKTVTVERATVVAAIWALGALTGMVMVSYTVGCWALFWAWTTATGAAASSMRALGTMFGSIMMCADGGFEVSTDVVVW